MRQRSSQNSADGDAALSGGDRRAVAVGVQTDAIDAALSGGDRRAVAVGVQTEVPPLAGDLDVCHVCYQYATVQTHHIYHLGFLAGEHFT